jgi:protein FAM32A
MPSDDYTAATGGGLRLKGVKDSRIDKKKKKKKEKKDAEAFKSVAKNEKAGERSLDKVLASEDEKEKEEESLPAGAGKTEAEKRHEERRRKRVCLIQNVLESANVLMPLGP